MFETFKLGYAAGLGVIAAAITGLAVLGFCDWLGVVLTRLKVAWNYWNQERRPNQ
jgi:hypothetical protein